MDKQRTFWQPRAAVVAGLLAAALGWLVVLAMSDGPLQTLPASQLGTPVMRALALAITAAAVLLVAWVTSRRSPAAFALIGAIWGLGGGGLYLLTGRQHRLDQIVLHGAWGDVVRYPYEPMLLTAGVFLGAGWAWLTLAPRGTRGLAPRPSWRAEAGAAPVLALLMLGTLLAFHNIVTVHEVDREHVRFATPVWLIPCIMVAVFTGFLAARFPRAGLLVGALGTLPYLVLGGTATWSVDLLGSFVERSALLSYRSWALLGVAVMAAALGGAALLRRSPAASPA